MENTDELKLRPQFLNEYIGQNDLKRNLRVYIDAALAREETLDHILIYGPPGLGKTTLANIIANEMKANLHLVSGPALEKMTDIASILADIQPGDILFIDEIHRIPRNVEEALYSAMEDYKFSITINRETSSKLITIDLPPFTLIGATTKAGNLSSPLRARFGIVEKLDFYTDNEIELIMKRTATVFNCKINDDACTQIAKCCRKTPRIANRIFKRVRDFSSVNNSSAITRNDVNKALKAMRIDEIGLDEIDIKYLNTLIERFNGGPVGIDTLAKTIGEEIQNLEDMYEPYLLQIAFIERTPKGRKATHKAYTHLKNKKKK